MEDRPFCISCEQRVDEHSNCKCLTISEHDTKARYQDLARRTEAPITKEIITRLEENARLIHGACGLATESGELFSAIKKHIIYGVPLDVANIKEELGDLQWYIAAICNSLNFDLEEVQRENIEKLKRRFPEEKFTEEAVVERRDKC